MDSSRDVNRNLCPNFSGAPGFASEMLLEMDSAMMKRRLGLVRSSVVTALLGHASRRQANPPIVRCHYISTSPTSRMTYFIIFRTNTK